jgi:hypothetical protein
LDKRNQGSQESEELVQRKRHALFMTISNKAIRQFFWLVLWAFWIIFVIWVSYKIRFWINNDTIGSLDSARYIKSFQLIHAINGYWGIGYAALLSLLPLRDINSWIQVHLLVAALILISQILIYRSLLYFNVSQGISTAFCIIWGAINYSTGGAIFITADTTLCLFASLYLFIFVRAEKTNTIYEPSSNLLLGSVHGIAWLTKTVALPGLALFPVLLSLRIIIDSNGLKSKLLKLIKFMLLYSLPLLIIFLFWGIGTYKKYGRFTFGFSSAHAYALCVDKSEKLLKAREKASHRLPLYGTYWWSDIGLSLTNWDFRTHFNLKKQLRRFPENIKEFISSDAKLIGFAIIILFLFSLYACFRLRYHKIKWYSILLLITAVGYSIIIIYSAVLLDPRYLSFATIYLLPICAVYSDIIFRNGNQLEKYCVSVIILLALLHGIGTMTYIALYRSPNDSDFYIAKKIKEMYKSPKLYGPIGAFLNTRFQIHHHAVIANILKCQTAEITPIKSNLSVFSASFSPKTVLFVLNPSTRTPSQITVNSKRYEKLYSRIWEKGKEKTEIIIYKPLFCE